MLLGLAILPIACSYRLVRHHAGRDVEATVSIRTLANDTLEPGLELAVGRALRREFLRGGRMRLVEDAGRADYSISGRVSSLETASRSFSSGVRALEFTVVIRLELDLVSRDGRRLEVDPFALSESEIYLASADIEVSRKNREEALRRLAGLLASRVYDEVDLLTSGGEGDEAG